MEEFIQIFRKVARDSSYEGRVLIEEYKREINRRIRRRLIEVEYPLKNIN